MLQPQNFASNPIVSEPIATHTRQLSAQTSQRILSIVRNQRIAPVKEDRNRNISPRIVDFVVIMRIIEELEERVFRHVGAHHSGRLNHKIGRVEPVHILRLVQHISATPSRVEKIRFLVDDAAHPLVTVVAHIVVCNRVATNQICLHTQPFSHRIEQRCEICADPLAVFQRPSRQFVGIRERQLHIALRHIVAQAGRLPRIERPKAGLYPTVMLTDIGRQTVDRSRITGRNINRHIRIGRQRLQA